MSDMENKPVLFTLQDLRNIAFLIREINTNAILYFINCDDKDPVAYLDSDLILHSDYLVAVTEGMEDSLKYLYDELLGKYDDIEKVQRGKLYHFDLGVYNKDRIPKYLQIIDFCQKLEDSYRNKELESSLCKLPPEVGSYIFPDERSHIVKQINSLLREREIFITPAVIFFYSNILERTSIISQLKEIEECNDIAVLELFDRINSLLSSKVLHRFLNVSGRSRKAQVFDYLIYGQRDEMLVNNFMDSRKIDSDEIYKNKQTLFDSFCDEFSKFNYTKVEDTDRYFLEIFKDLAQNKNIQQLEHIGNVINENIVNLDKYMELLCSDLVSFEKKLRDYLEIDFVLWEDLQKDIYVSIVFEYLRQVKKNSYKIATKSVVKPLFEMPKFTLFKNSNVIDSSIPIGNLVFLTGGNLEEIKSFSTAFSKKTDERLLEKIVTSEEIKDNIFFKESDETEENSVEKLFVQLQTSIFNENKSFVFMLKIFSEMIRQGKASRKNVKMAVTYYVEDLFLKIAQEEIDFLYDNCDRIFLSYGNLNEENYYNYLYRKAAIAVLRVFVQTYDIRIYGFKIAQAKTDEDGVPLQKPLIGNPFSAEIYADKRNKIEKIATLALDTVKVLCSSDIIRNMVDYLRMIQDRIEIEEIQDIGEIQEEEE